MGLDSLIFLCTKIEKYHGENGEISECWPGSSGWGVGRDRDRMGQTFTTPSEDFSAKLVHGCFGAVYHCHSFPNGRA